MSESSVMHDLTIRLRCRECASMIADDMRKRFPMVSTVSIAVTARDHMQNNAVVGTERHLSAMLKHWPDAKPCEMHDTAWIETEALRPEVKER